MHLSLSGRAPLSLNQFLMTNTAPTAGAHNAGNE